MAKKYETWRSEKKPKKEVPGTAKVRQRSTRHGEGTHCPQIPSLILELPRVHGHRGAGLEPKGGSFLSKRQRQTVDLELTPRIKRIGHAARRSEPGNRAHTFRMTFVAQGKLPQIRNVCREDILIRGWGYYTHTVSSVLTDVILTV